MRFSSVIIGCGLLISSVTASAEPVVPVVQQDFSGAHFTIGGGITYGGDTLGTVYYSSGSSADIKAGALIHFYGGLMYHFYGSPVAARLAFGYHFDQATAVNGTATFDRTTLEVVPFYLLPPRSRIGVGLTRHMSPTLDATDFGAGTVKFQDATGLVMEYGYNVSGHAWIDFRYVSITYDVQNFSASADGSHLGVYLSAEF